eukprot:8974462-Lingulodinium_polyedra.AAC.1
MVGKGREDVPGARSERPATSDHSRPEGQLLREPLALCWAPAVEAHHMPDTEQRDLLVPAGHRVGRQAEAIDAGFPDFHQHVWFVAAFMSQLCRGG